MCMPTSTNNNTVANNIGLQLTLIVFQTLGAAMLKARSPNLSRDRGRNKSMFDADLRTVGPVSVAYFQL